MQCDTLLALQPDQIDFLYWVYAEVVRAIVDNDLAGAVVIGKD
jgi:hypothetical protein